MPRRREPGSARVVHRTAQVRLRTTAGQRRRLFGLLVSAGDVWACVLEANWWRRYRHVRPLVGYQQLFRELVIAGPGTFGDLDTEGARSVLRRFSDAWFAVARRRKAGDTAARFPRRRRRLMPIRWYHGTFTLSGDGRRVRLPTAAGCPPLWVRLSRPLPYPVEQVRSVTLLADSGRLFLDVTAEVPVATYPPEQVPDPQRVAGVDLGIIHPYAVAGPDQQGLLISGRAIRAEHHLHLRDTKARRKATAARAPSKRQVGSRRWRKTRRRTSKQETRHRRRVRQAQHEAAKAVVTWAVKHRVGTLGHRDLSAAAIIATRIPGGGITTPAVSGVVTHRRAGTHLPGAGKARRDPRRRPPMAGGTGSVGRPPARPTTSNTGGGGESLAHGEDPQPNPTGQT